MPGFDSTGPAGRGPMTGWGRGYCSTSANAGVLPPDYGPAYQWTGPISGIFKRLGLGSSRGNRGGLGMGLGRGCGFGYGRRRAHPGWGRW